jgi:hypothetical protein
MESLRITLKHLYSNKLGNLVETDKCLHTYDQIKLNQEDVSNLNRYLTTNEIEAAMKRLPKKKSSGPAKFTVEFYQTFKEKLIPILLNLFHGITLKTYVR